MPTEDGTFHHLSHFDFAEIETIEKDGKRHYSTPVGVLPSVTTLLSLTKEEKDKKVLKEWRERVGEEEADRITKQSTISGTDLHLAIENFLKNLPEHNMYPATKWMMHSLKPVLKRHIGTIYAQEVPLYSQQLGFAGRVDCVAMWKEQLSIIDFKTARKAREPEMIEDYFIQCCAYAIMYSIMTGIPVKRFAIVMIEKTGMDVQLFEGNTADYVGKLMNKIKKFRELNGTQSAAPN